MAISLGAIDTTTSSPTGTISAVRPGRESSGPGTSGGGEYTPTTGVYNNAVPTGYGTRDVSLAPGSGNLYGSASQGATTSPGSGSTASSTVTGSHGDAPKDVYGNQIHDKDAAMPAGHSSMLLVILAVGLIAYAVLG